jgi:hypothetical protein
VSYIQSELDALEREQEAIDLKANDLEKKLRAVMAGTLSKYFFFIFSTFTLGRIML